MRINYLAKLVMFLSIALPIVPCISAQRIYPIRGGTRFDVDSDNKKRLVLVAENKEIKLLFKPSDGFNPKKGNIWVLWLKVENLSDKPLAFDPTKFSAVDDEGRALSGLEAGVAIQRFYDSTAMISDMLGRAIAGPLSGPPMVKATERSGAQRLIERSMQKGEIPPNSFKDGMIFFEKSKGNSKELKVSLVGLWHEPIIFSPDEKRMPKPGK